ncbi:hypothetical protein SAMN05421690_100276 [Nitrosomonas sp. Nm51]|nr:hypothetical protein SAMN05421690_100276 [Nitrosomonas sp. Nm51]
MILPDAVSCQSECLARRACRKSPFLLSKGVALTQTMGADKFTTAVGYHGVLQLALQYLKGHYPFLQMKRLDIVIGSIKNNASKNPLLNESVKGRCIYH